MLTCTAHLNTCSLEHFFDHLLTCIAQCTRAPLSLHQQGPASKITGWHNSSRLSQRKRDRGGQGGVGGDHNPPLSPLAGHSVTQTLSVAITVQSESLGRHCKETIHCCHQIHSVHNNILLFNATLYCAFSMYLLFLNAVQQHK